MITTVKAPTITTAPTGIPTARNWENKYY